MRFGCVTSYYRLHRKDAKVLFEGHVKYENQVSNYVEIGFPRNRENGNNFLVGYAMN